MRQQPDGLHGLLGHAPIQQLFQGDAAVLTDIVQKGRHNGSFDLLLLGYKIGCKI